MAETSSEERLTDIRANKSCEVGMCSVGAVETGTSGTLKSVTGLSHSSIKSCRLFSTFGPAGVAFIFLVHSSKRDRSREVALAFLFVGTNRSVICRIVRQPEIVIL